VALAILDGCHDRGGQRRRHHGAVHFNGMGCGLLRDRLFRHAANHAGAIEAHIFASNFKHRPLLGAANPHA